MQGGQISFISYNRKNLRKECRRINAGISSHAFAIESGFKRVCYNVISDVYKILCVFYPSLYNSLSDMEGEKRKVIETEKGDGDGERKRENRIRVCCLFSMISSVTYERARHYCAMSQQGTMRPLISFRRRNNTTVCSRKKTPFIPVSAAVGRRYQVRSYLSSFLLQHELYIKTSNNSKFTLSEFLITRIRIKK